MKRSWCPNFLRLPTALTLIGLLVFAFIEVKAHAADFVYLDSSFNKTTVTEALIKSMKGEVTYKCAPQESKVSKSGSSIGLKAKKKKITKEQAEEIIKETKERIDK